MKHREYCRYYVLVCTRAATYRRKENNTDSKGQIRRFQRSRAQLTLDMYVLFGKTLLFAFVALQRQPLAQVLYGHFTTVTIARRDIPPDYTPDGETAPLFSFS